MKKMQKLWSVIVVLLLIGSVTGCTKASSNLSLSEKSKIVIGLDDTFAPMGFKDPATGEIVGFDIDLAKEVINKRLGKEVEFKAIDWNTKEAELQSGKIDVIWNGLTITDERKQNMSFTLPYLSSKQMIVTQKGKNTYTSQAEIVSKKVAVQTDSTGEAAVKKAFPNLTLQAFDDNTMAIQALRNGQVDIVVVDQIFIEYYMKQNKDSNLETNKVIDFGMENVGVGASKSNQTFLDEISKKIDETKSDGTYEKIKNKWFQG